MKKILVLASLAALSSGVFAATACSGGTATNVTGATDGSKFVRTTFAPSCSPNTEVVYTDDGGKVYGGSASIKGKAYFGASTNGGAVQKVGDCSGSGACGTTASAAAGSGMAAASTYGATQ